VTVDLGEFTAEVVLKAIKNVHLSVYPPRGAVRISAPLHMQPDTIRVFALSKLSWLKQQRRKIQEQERETAREYLSAESHYVWGKRYLLRIEETLGPSSYFLEPRHLVLRLHPQTAPASRAELLEAWYRDLLKAEINVLLPLWQPRLGVRTQRFSVQKMKTRWGSCQPETKTIRLNTELARKPKECLTYVVVHELVHLIEPHHSPRFVALMDQFLPEWPRLRDLLNRLPLSHWDWEY